MESVNLYLHNDDNADNVNDYFDDQPVINIYRPIDSENTRHEQDQDQIINPFGYDDSYYNFSSCNFFNSLLDDTAIDNTYYNNCPFLNDAFINFNNNIEKKNSNTIEIDFLKHGNYYEFANYQNILSSLKEDLDVFTDFNTFNAFEPLEIKNIKDLNIEDNINYNTILETLKKEKIEDSPYHKMFASMKNNTLSYYKCDSELEMVSIKDNDFIDNLPIYNDNFTNYYSTIEFENSLLNDISDEIMELYKKKFHNLAYDSQYFNICTRMQNSRAYAFYNPNIDMLNKKNENSGGACVFYDSSSKPLNKKNETSKDKKSSIELNAADIETLKTINIGELQEQLNKLDNSVLKDEFKSVLINLIKVITK